MKTAVITGANAGIGFATARYIAAHPEWHVVLACRSQTKAAAASQLIRADLPKAAVTILPLDLLSLQSVRDFPPLLGAAGLPPLRTLILNAGGINMKAKELEFSRDGYECIFQLNFLGHFVLCNLLVRALQAPARVIFVSSDLHDPQATKMGRFTPPRYGRVEDAARARGLYSKIGPMARYATAKMFAMMAAREFDRRFRGSGKSGITFNSWSPGVVPTTQAGRHMSPLQKKIMTSAPFVSFMGSHLSTEEEAAHALGGLVLDAAFEGVSGLYFDGNRQIPSSAESRDEDKAKAVWNQAARLADVMAEEPL